MRRSVFVFAALLLVCAALYAVTSMWLALARLDRLDGAGEAMLRAEESRTIAQGFLASTVNIETATRGFVLQGEPALLTPFDDARARTPQQLDALRDHVRTDPEQLSRVDRVTRELAQLITLSELIIERRRVTSAATDEVAELADRAMAATKAIRALVDEIDAAESQRLGAARVEWQSGLRDARTTEIAMCALTIAVIVLAAWVLARLRRGRLLPGPEDAAADTGVDPLCSVGMHLEAALDAADRAQAECGANAATSARLGPMRGGIEGVLDLYTRIADDTALPAAVHCGALDVALHELARRAARRPGTVVREAVAANPEPIDPAQARLLYRAAEWAERVLMRRPRDGEMLVELKKTESRTEVRVEGPCTWDRNPNELSAAERHAHERLAAEVAAAGGSCHWTADPGRGRLDVTLPRAVGPSSPPGDARVPATR